jgi:hypothetical protein
MKPPSQIQKNVVVYLALSGLINTIGYFAETYTKKIRMKS